MSLPLGSVSRVFYCFLLLNIFLLFFILLDSMCLGEQPYCSARPEFLVLTNFCEHPRCLLSSQWFLEVESVPRPISVPKAESQSTAFKVHK